MCQDDILRVLSKSRRWFSSKDLSKELNISYNSVNKNLNGLFKVKDYVGLDFYYPRKNKRMVRKK